MHDLRGDSLARLKTFGVDGRVDGRFIRLTYNGVETRVIIDEEDEGLYQEYRSLNGAFDLSDSSFTYDSQFIIPLVRLGNDILREEEIILSDSAENEVLISRAFLTYGYAFFFSDKYKLFFDRVVSKRLSQTRLKVPRSISFILYMPFAANFTSMLPISTAGLRTVAYERVRTALAKLAIERSMYYEIVPAAKYPVPRGLEAPIEYDTHIPNVVYDNTLLAYYKVGGSSPFASQSFLSYYHVLEYHFLRVSETELHDKLRALLSSSNFHISTDGIDRAISLIKKNTARDDETEMLRKVMAKFTSAEDFISFVTNLEDLSGQKTYSKGKKIFGFDAHINLSEEQVISSAARVLKNLRNAIVHSSDKYERDERHIPLTESEDTISNYVPLVRYFAEKAIFGTATPSTNPI